MLKALILLTLVCGCGVTFAATDQRAPTELDITQQLHDALIVRNDLSTEAQNIQIVTLGGKTVLSGPVASEVEKRKVDALAHTVVGKLTAIDDELTVSN